MSRLLIDLVDLERELLEDAFEIPSRPNATRQLYQPTASPPAQFRANPETPKAFSTKSTSPALNLPSGNAQNDQTYLKAPTRISGPTSNKIQGGLRSWVASSSSPPSAQPFPQSASRGETTPIHSTNGSTVIEISPTSEDEQYSRSRAAAPSPLSANLFDLLSDSESNSNDRTYFSSPSRPPEASSSQSFSVMLGLRQQRLEERTKRDDALVANSATKSSSLVARPDEWIDMNEYKAASPSIPRLVSSSKPTPKRRKIDEMDESEAHELVYNDISETTPPHHASVILNTDGTLSPISPPQLGSTGAKYANDAVFDVVLLDDRSNSSDSGSAEKSHKKATRQIVLDQFFLGVKLGATMAPDLRSHGSSVFKKKPKTASKPKTTIGSTAATITDVDDFDIVTIAPKNTSTTAWWLPAGAPKPKVNVNIPYETVNIPKIGSGALPFTSIQPYAFEEPALQLEGQGNCRYYDCQVNEIPWEKITEHGPYVGVLIDPPWTPKTGARLLEYIRISAEIIPAGFMFMWVEKEYLPAALKVMKKWKFEYVENLAWVQKHVNNRFVEKSSPYFTKSKLTLLICRRGKGGIELRHQRNPDVIFEPLRFLKEDEGGLREDKPLSVYTTIETLLPEARYSSATNQIPLLELWSKKSHSRPNWVSVHMKSASTPIEESDVMMSQADEVMSSQLVTEKPVLPSPITAASTKRAQEGDAPLPRDYGVSSLSRALQFERASQLALSRSNSIQARCDIVISSDEDEDLIADDVMDVEENDEVYYFDPQSDHESSPTRGNASPQAARINGDSDNEAVLIDDSSILSDRADVPTTTAVATDKVNVGVDVIIPETPPHSEEHGGLDTNNDHLHGIMDSDEIWFD